MEGSIYWGYGYKTQHSYPRSPLITRRRPEVKFGWNVVKKKQHKNYQDGDKKSAINKKLILRLRSLISKWFQLKTIPPFKYFDIFIIILEKTHFHSDLFPTKNEILNPLSVLVYPLFLKSLLNICNTYLPIPPLGQDMTQGQFLSQV